MNKVLFALMTFLYVSSCKETKSPKAKEQEKATTDTVVTAPADQQASEDDYKNVIIEDPKDISDGEHSQYYKSGKLKAKGYYKDGKRDGHWTVFFESGVLWSEADYTDGKKNGRATVYYPNGQKRYEGVYESDKRVGIWKYYDRNGSLVQEEKQGR